MQGGGQLSWSVLCKGVASYLGVCYARGRPVMDDPWNVCFAWGRPMMDDPECVMRGEDQYG